MILYKWVTPMDDPPSIINSLIAMGMWQRDSSPMFGSELPKMLMAVTMLTVPWMLIPKPVILWMRSKREHANGGGHGAGGHDADGAGHALNDEGKLEDGDHEE